MTSSHGRRIQSRRALAILTWVTLVVVAGLMLGFIWWTRKNQLDGSVQLPNDLVEVLGRVTLDAKHKAHLVRFGDRILLLSLDGPGISKIGEIGVPDSASQALAAPNPVGRGRTSPAPYPGPRSRAPGCRWDAGSRVRRRARGERRAAL